MLAKSTQENKSIYYERAVPFEDLPKPDPQNFATMTDMSAELNQTPELDEKLRHIVPPAVRVLQDELKVIL